MPFFRCSECKSIDNTTLASNSRDRALNGKPLLCSECDPEIKKWHGKFPKEKFDPKKWRISDAKLGLVTRKDEEHIVREVMTDRGVKTTTRKPRSKNVHYRKRDNG